MYCVLNCTLRGPRLQIFKREESQDHAGKCQEGAALLRSWLVGLGKCLVLLKNLLAGRSLCLPLG